MFRSSRAALLLTSILLVTGGCEAEDKQQAQAVAAKAAKQAEKGVGQAKDAAQEVARKTEDGVQAGVKKAREGIADAREHYDVDEKLDGAKEQFGAAMDETADGLSELAAAGKAESAELAKRFGPDKLELEPGAVACEPPRDGTRSCQVSAEVVQTLHDRPMLLARDGWLTPKTGELGKGLVLSSPDPGGLADSIGLRDGDILLELNGVTLDSFDAIRSLDEAMSGKHEATLTFERDGERQAIEIQQRATDPAAPPSQP